MPGRKRDRTFAGVLFIAAAGLFVSGCGSGNDMASVTGKITFQNQPVPEGTITFYPESGGRPSSGQIQSDGTYKLSSIEPGDGAMIGTHKVTIEARRVLNAPAGPSSFQEELAQERGRRSNTPLRIEWLVPQEYSAPSTTELTAKVENESNVIDFNLP